MSLIGRFEHLPNRPKSDQARPLLEKIASQVKPIMSKRGWKVGTLAEFLPADPSLLGINTNRGQRINLRLRPPGAEDTFYEYDQLVLVMLHELTHIVHGPHAAPFYKLLKELEDEFYALKTRGYSGDGFHSDGHHLGAVRRNEYDGRKKGLAAAEERLGRARVLGKGGKLGGSGSGGKSMKELVVEAAERRLKDDKVCKTEEHSDEVEKEIKKAQQESIGVDAEELSSVAPAASPKASAESIPRPARERLEKEPVASDSSSRRLPAKPAKPARPRSPNTAATPIVIDSSPEPKDIPASRHNPTPNPNSFIFPNDWSCPTCTLINQPTSHSCEACSSPRPGKRTPGGGEKVEGWFCEFCGAGPREMGYWSCGECGWVRKWG